MTRTIVITSGKGGVGKTTSAINLGVALNKFGRDVIVVDANITTPNVSIHLGAPEIPVSLHHVLSSKAEPEEAIYEHSSGIKVVPGSISPAHMKSVKYENFDGIIKKIKRFADFVIVDCAAGLGKEANMAIKATDEVLVITQPEIAALTDALKTIKLAEKMDKIVLGVILTRTTGKKYELKKDNVEEMLEVPVLAVIPEDDNVKESLRQKDAVFSLYPNTKASLRYEDLAAKILGIKVKRRKQNFIQNLFEKIKIRI